ncbi:MAG: ATP-binding protein [Micrococcales bacterium]
MTPFNSEPRKFAVERVDRTIARVFSTCAAFIIFLQAIAHAFQQREILNPWGLWVGVAVIGGLTLAELVFAWLGRNLIWLYLAFYVATLVGVLAWPFSLREGAHLAPNDHPWLWWVLAIAALCGFGAFKPVYAFGAAIVLNGAWLFVLGLDGFGVRGFGVVLQDTLLAFFFGVLFGVLLMALRQETARVDEALEQRAVTTANAARVRASESERARVDALVHDSVLTTLITGANASDQSQVEQASRLAQQALARLQGDVSMDAPENVSAAAFFDSLAQAALEVAADLQVSREQVGDIVVPGEVAQALTEASLQAVTNSVQHAGTVKNRQLRLTATSNRIKVVVIDDGRGFREARIAKYRLGVRLSIRERVTSVGGRVAIQSQPGEGCTVTMSWSQAGGPSNQEVDA